MSLNLSRAAGALVVLSALVGAGSAVQAQTILTAVESRKTGPGVEPRNSPSSSLAGQLVSTTFGGADSRALTDFGINKVYSRGTATHRQYATSNWLDSYTVAGTPGSTVNVSFNFAVDGNINVNSYGDGPNSETRANFSVYALTGSNWSLGGESQNPGDNGGFLFTPLVGGDQYVQVHLKTTTVDPLNRFIQFSPTYFEGFKRFNAVNGQAGTSAGSFKYDEATDTYRLTTRSASGINGSFIESLQIYAPNTFSEIRNGVMITPPTPYSSLPSQRLVSRNNLKNNSVLLDVDRMCPTDFGFCKTGDYPGSNLAISFSVLAGSSFTLLSSLHSMDLYDEGTVDFFNTAKMTGASVSPGATLTSQSGALMQLAGGSYGYAAVLASVPEPDSWAMLIAGFGLTGAALRRRRALPRLMR